MLFSNLFLGHKKRKNGEPGGPVTEKDLGRRGMQPQEPQEEGSLHPSVWGSACEAPGGHPAPCTAPSSPMGEAGSGWTDIVGKENRGQAVDTWKAGVPRRVVKFC